MTSHGKSILTNWCVFFPIFPFNLYASLGKIPIRGKDSDSTIFVDFNMFVMNFRLKPLPTVVGPRVVTQSQVDG